MHITHRTQLPPLRLTLINLQDIVSFRYRTLEKCVLDVCVWDSQTHTFHSLGSFPLQVKNHTSPIMNVCAVCVCRVCDV